MSLNLEGITISGLKKNSKRGWFEIDLLNNIKIVKSYNFLSHKITVQGNVLEQSLPENWKQVKNHKQLILDSDTNSSELADIISDLIKNLKNENI